MLVCSEISNEVKVPLIVKILSSVLSKLPTENQKCKVLYVLYWYDVT